LAQVDGADVETIAFLTDGNAEPVGTRGEAQMRDDVAYWAVG
jgi:hypothetical protein